MINGIKSKEESDVVKWLRGMCALGSKVEMLG